MMGLSIASNEKPSFQHVWVIGGSGRFEIVGVYRC